jgi:hypothetical protein
VLCGGFGFFSITASSFFEDLKILGSKVRLQKLVFVQETLRIQTNYGMTNYIFLNFLITITRKALESFKEGKRLQKWRFFVTIDFGTRSDNEN